MKIRIFVDLKCIIRCIIKKFKVHKRKSIESLEFVELEKI